jgi:hypothetical protein
MKDFKIIFNDEERKRMLKNLEWMSYYINEIICDFSISEYDDDNVIKLKEYMENIRSEFE